MRGEVVMRRKGFYNEGVEEFRKRWKNGEYRERENWEEG